MTKIQDSSQTIKPSNPKDLVRKNGISANMTLINFLKGMIGPGCFSLPLAFLNAGLWTGFVLVFAIGFCCCVSMMKLVRCSQYLSVTYNNGTCLDYGSLAEYSVRYGFGGISKFHSLAKTFVNMCLVVLQIGVCSIFFIFVCDHAQEVVEHFHPEWTTSKYVYMSIGIVPFWLVAMVSSIKIISWVSLIGNVFMVASIGIIFGQLITSHHNINLPWITNFDGVVLAAGAIVYSFEGQAMVLPLENRMKYGRDMRGWTGVLSTGMELVTIIYVSCGFFGYITYGSKVEGSITLNLPDDDLNLAVKILLMLVILTGFPVQMYPIVESLWPWIDKKLGDASKTKRFFAHYGLRTTALFVSITLAATIPNLENIIPLVGVTAGMLLALIIPSLIDTNTFLPQLLKERRTGAAAFLIIQNTFFFAIGIFFFVTGVQSNIENLLNQN